MATELDPSNREYFYFVEDTSQINLAFACLLAV